jgi:Tol biopolymer transport system component
VNPGEIVGLDGQDARRVLPNSTGEQGATCSPDGQWVVYRSYRDSQLWRVGLDGSRPTVLTKYSNAGAPMPALSPDGQSIAYVTVDRDQRFLNIISAEGVPPLRQLPLPLTSITVGWTPDGSNISFAVGPAFDNLWIQPIAGGPPRRLTEFTSEMIFRHAWSRTGQLLLARGVVATDVVVIKDW